MLSCRRRRAPARPRCRASCWSATRGSQLSISVTTRPRRASEIEGAHYRFIDQKTFVAMRDSGELLEWAEVHGNFYGTPREPVERRWRRAATCCSTSTGRAPSSCARRCARTICQRLHPAAVGRRTEGAAGAARRGQRGDDPAAACETPPKKSSHWREYDYVARQPTTSTRASRAARDPCRPSGSSAERQPGSRAFVGATCRRDLTPLARVAAFAPRDEDVRQRDEALDRDLLGARGRFDAGGVQQRRRHRARASSGSAAASCGAGRRRLRSRVAALARRTASGAARGMSRTTDGGHLRRRHEGARRHVEQDLGLACASPPAPPAGHRPCRPGAATMRSATSRWNISISASYQGGHGSTVSQPTSSAVAIL